MDWKLTDVLFVVVLVAFLATVALVALAVEMRWPQPTNVQLWELAESWREWTQWL